MRTTEDDDRTATATMYQRKKLHQSTTSQSDPKGQFKGTDMDHQILIYKTENC